MNHDNEKNPRVDNTPENTEDVNAAAPAEQTEAAQDSAPEISEEVQAAADQAKKRSEEKKKKNKDKKKEKMTLKQRLTSQKFKHGSMATALTAVFIVAVVLVNVLVGILGERFPSMNLDMTKSADNSLSEEAAEVVDTVDEKTEIIIMMEESTAKSNANYQKVDAISAKMAERNSNITVEYKNPDKEPGMLSEYDGLTSGSVLVRTEKRYRVVTSSDLFPVKYDQSTYQQISYTDVNGALASALSAVNADTMPIVAFDTGHDEMLDMTSYKEILNDNNFDTVDFNLLTEEIPESAQIVVLGVPATDLSEAEVEKLNTYLNDTSTSMDRSVMVVSYPAQGELPVLNSYLNEWGMNVTPAEVIEGDSSSYVQSPEMILANVSDSLDLDGADSYSYILSPQTNPIEILWEGRNSVSTHPLLTSSESSYIYDVATQEEKKDETGSYNLAAAGVKMIKGEDGDYFNANVIVIGSPYLFNASFTGSSTYGNGQYIADLSKYATGTTGSSTAVYSTPTQTITYDIAMSGGQIMFIGLGVFTVLIPLAFLITGIVVFFRRRHL